MNFLNDFKASAETKPEAPAVEPQLIDDKQLLQVGGGIRVEPGGPFDPERGG